MCKSASERTTGGIWIAAFTTGLVIATTCLVNRAASPAVASSSSVLRCVQHVRRRFWRDQSANIRQQKKTRSRPNITRVFVATLFTGFWRPKVHLLRHVTLRHHTHDVVRVVTVVSFVTCRACRDERVAPCCPTSAKQHVTTFSCPKMHGPLWVVSCCDGTLRWNYGLTTLLKLWLREVSPIQATD